MIGRWDRAVVEAFQDAHWGPADWCFELLSQWWVKSLLILGVALLADLRWRRFPPALLVATVAYFAAGGIAEGLRAAVDRARPPVADPSIHPLVNVPDSGSMPSGHAATAFAAALAAGLVHPRLRWPLLMLAALVAISRVWLGVHYLSDVVVGAALGSAVALGAWLTVRAAGRAFRARTRSAGSASGVRPAPAGAGREEQLARQPPRA